MSTVDQAFIRAFAKNRSAACSVQESAPAGAKVQSPDMGIESTALVFEDLDAQGRRYRIDRPTSADAGYLTAHMIMPSTLFLIEHTS